MVQPSGSESSTWPPEAVERSHLNGVWSFLGGLEGEGLKFRPLFPPLFPAFSSLLSTLPFPSPLSPPPSQQKPLKNSGLRPEQAERLKP